MPKVEAIERDYSHYVAYAAKTVLAVVGTASKGPVNEAVAVTSAKDLVNKFGSLRTDCFGLYAAQYFLSQSSKMYFVRAAGESVAASTITIPGIDADDEEVASGMVISVIEKGTFSNGYTAHITVDDQDKYTIIIKDTNSNTIDKIEKVELVDLIVGYKTNLIEVALVDPTIAKLVAGSYEFANGNDGIEDISSVDYIEAVNKLKSKTVDANLISVPGVSDAEVVVAMISIAEQRGDCLSLIDPPKGLTRDGVINWVKGGGDYSHSAFNSSYAAVYYDWVNIYDSINKVQVQVPPSVPVVATYAYSDRISDVWYAPAGLTRGLIHGVLSSVTKLDEDDVGLLYEAGINPIYEDPQVGLVVWGQKTIYNQDTALNRVNVRRLMNYLKKVITAACKYLVFEPNDRLTWNSFELKVIPVLTSIKNRRGIYEYRVVKGETIVTPEDIDNYRMPCMIMVRPTKSAEEIPIYFVITSTGADFNEVLESNGVV